MNPKIWIFLQTNYNFSGQQTECAKWFEKIIGECNWRGNEADLRACCRNQGVPYECSGYCTLKEVGNMWMWKCEEWEPQIRKCNEGNDGYLCCQEQGVPKECSAYCKTS